MTTPAIVLKTQFTLSTSKDVNFNKFVNYIDRKNTHANENDFATYQNYMSNEEKSSGLFTNALDSLSEADMDKVKEVMTDAQKNKSVLWQDVISFDNQWLKEVGILQTKNDEPFLDEVKLKQATRNAVNAMWKHEGIQDSVFWTAAIHYNTDNIHVHVATVQTRDFRERGKRKQRSLDFAKSSVAHTLMDRSKENEKLNDFIRNKVITTMKDEKILKPFDRKIKKQFLSIYAQLPEDRRIWKYGMNGMKELRPEINKLTEMYIEKHFKKEFVEFKKQLDNEVKLYERTYGSQSRAEKYRETKMDDLYKRCGNTILQELKQYDSKVKVAEANRMKNNWNKQRTKFEMSRAANQTMYRMNRLLRDDMENVKNQREFERFEHERGINR